MLAWQHSQLIFHFEVFQTHGARLLCERQTGQRERQVTGGHLINTSYIIWDFVTHHSSRKGMHNVFLLVKCTEITCVQVNPFLTP